MLPNLPETDNEFTNITFALFNTPICPSPSILLPQLSQPKEWWGGFESYSYRGNSTLTVYMLELIFAF